MVNFGGGGGQLGSHPMGEIRPQINPPFIAQIINKSFKMPIISQRAFVKNYSKVKLLSQGQKMQEKEINLEKFKQEVGACKKCKLSTTRNNVVFGDGNPNARVVFIGEGPGRDEDLQGIPFVGRSGQLLTAIIEKGMKLRRSDVYICNVVKCRPTVDLKFTRDRPPDESETAACSPYLTKQLEIIAPEAIITLGNPATRFLLKTKVGITRLRGKWHEFNGIPLMPTFHPSYILRNGGDNSPLKKEVWHDIKLVMKRLGI